MRNNCYKCDISVTRKNIVWGYGKTPADIMFIGEAPGYNEDKYGLPFIGLAGKTLTEFLNMIDISRDDVYITNIIRCRPPHNRVPKLIEIQNCFPYLGAEVVKANPRIIVTLGVTALSIFSLERAVRMNISRGIPFVYGKRVILPMYHPSYLLREPDKIDVFNKDFMLLAKMYAIVNPFYSFNPI